METRSLQRYPVRAGALTEFAALVRELGGNPASILRGCGLHLRDLARPDHYISHRSAILAVEAAAHALGVRDFGLRLCVRQDVSFLGTLALIMQSARSVREGFVLGIKYSHFHAPCLGYRIFRSDDMKLEFVEVFLRSDDLPDAPQATEHAVGHLCRLVSLLSDHGLQPSGIHFRHQRVGAESQYRRHLGQLPQFGAAFDGLSVDPLAWRQPTVRHNRQLQHFVERFLLALAPRREWPVAAQVVSVLHNLMRTGLFDLGSVARVMALHPRTLQRRLHAEGKSFDALLDAERKSWAAELMAQRSLALADVAQLLGFADQSVFTRACRRWFGTTPKGLRQDVQAMSRLADDSAYAANSSTGTQLQNRLRSP